MSANSILNSFKNYCENVWEGGGGTFQGYVQYIDSLGYPNGYSCDGLTVNEGWITFWTCNTCTSKKTTDSLQIDKNLCGDICRKSNLSCSYIFGDISGNYYGTAYPSCGATDSTIVGCEELESSSSTEESSSSGEGEGGEDEESSSSGAGGGGEEGSSSSGETINPGEDEPNTMLTCPSRYYKKNITDVNYDTTRCYNTTSNVEVSFYNPPNLIGGEEAAINNSILVCYNKKLQLATNINKIYSNQYNLNTKCFNTTDCSGDYYIINYSGDIWSCVSGQPIDGQGCPLATNYTGFRFEVGSNGRLYYSQTSSTQYFLPSNITIDGLLNAKYDMYNGIYSNPANATQYAEDISLVDAFVMCDSILNGISDVTPEDTIPEPPETFSSSSAEGGENPPIDPPEGLTSSSAEGGGDNPPIGGNSSSGSGGSIGGGGGGITNGTGGRDESKAEQVYSSFMDKYSFSPLDTSGGTEGNYALREDVWKIYDILKDFASMMKEGVASLLGYGEAITENTDTLRHDLKLSLINDSTSIDLQISIDSLLRIIANSPIKFDSSYQETYDNGWSAVQQWMKSTIRTGSSGGSGGTF